MENIRVLNQRKIIATFNNYATNNYTFATNNYTFNAILLYVYSLCVIK